jgi:hypothetical protein
MPGFKITSFKGTAPKISPRLLAEDFGQVAKNCFLGTGDLIPYSGLENTVGITKTSTVTTDVISTVYNFRPSSTTSYWFHWFEDVDVVESPVVNDVDNKIYFTGAGGVPQVTNDTDAVTEIDEGNPTGEFPIASKALGLPAPVSPPTLQSLGGTATSTDPLDIEQRYYVYTYVDDDGGESAPSPTLGPISVQIGEQPTIAFPAGNFASAVWPYNAVNEIRLYVTATSSSATDFQFCGFTPYTTLTLEDAGVRNEVLATKTWAHPSPAMKGLTAMSNGILVGFEGSMLMFSEPYAPYAWPVEYQLGIDYDIVGLGVAGDQLVVCTKGYPYLAGGATSSAMSLTKIDIEQACVSKRSIVSILNGVIYASPDGLVYIDSSGPQLITSELMTRAQWQELNPSTIHGYQHDNLYYGFYSNDTKNAGFILDPTNKHFIEIDTYATAGYNDLSDDALYLVASNALKKWDSDTTKLESTWKSKKFVTPKPTSFSAAQVVASDYTTAGLEFTLLIDGVANNTITVFNSTAFRLPANVGSTWEVELVGKGVIEAVYVADSMAELGAMV